MAVRQYIGARYVTKIYENSITPGSAEWEAGVTYEPLTLVTYNYSSYLSKKEVPGSIGDPASNPAYWVVTGAYNGQIATLQSEIDDLEGRYLVINVADLPKNWGLTNLVGDDNTDNAAAFNDLITYLNNNLDRPYRRTLFFPSGRYIFESKISLPQYLTLQGEGTLNTSIKTATMVDDAFIECLGYNKIFDLNVQHIGPGVSNKHGIALLGIQCELARLRIYNFKNGIYMNDAGGTKTEQVYIESNISAFNGISMHGRCVSSKFFKTSIVASGVTNGTGFHYVDGDRCMDMNFLLCESSQLRYGFIFHAGTTPYPGDITINNCIFDGMHNSFVVVDSFNSDGNLNITDNWVNYDDVSSSTSIIDIDDSSNISISGNRFESLNSGGTSNLHAVNVTNGKNISIINNSLHNLKYAMIVNGAERLDASGNILDSNDTTAGNAFCNASGLESSSIINNKMHASTKYQYDALIYTTTNTIIKNNIFQSNAAISYSEASCIIDDNIHTS